MILRACDWHAAPFGTLNATPPDGKPITQYADRDQAMLEVAKAVRAAAERLAAKSSKKEPEAFCGVSCANPRRSAGNREVSAIKQSRTVEGLQ